MARTNGSVSLLPPAASLQRRAQANAPAA